ncbi:MAG: L,D-transpeptidase family protein [Campylobacterota bacterium]|nr:L,D-transpeptidase family protein [Campylobacterota bacterium]
MKKILLGLFFTFTTMQAQMADTKQLLVVSTKNWSTSNGFMQRYEKVEKSWQKVGKSIAIKLGRNGLGWGIGLHRTPKNAKYIKKEGDGKAPAGIFKLKQAFGYAQYSIAYPYTVYKRTDHCVDDVNSKLYNKIVDSKKIQKDYKSYEHMKLRTNYYKYGIVVDHNNIIKGKSKKGAGSCIFIHIKDKSTSGCTIMSEKEIKEILNWLDEASEPLLVQGVEKDIKMLISQIPL